MGKFDGILLMSDFDGTIYCDKNVSAENRQAIKYFQSEGGLFAIASGRPPKWLEAWKEYFTPNTYCAMMNGALITDPEGKEFIFESPMNNRGRDAARTMFELCRELAWLQFFTYKSIFEINNPLGVESDTVPSKVFKTICCVPAEKSDEYTQKLHELLDGEYLVMRSWINGIEVQNIGSGKGDALDRLRVLLGDRVKTVVAVGDFENDIDMIRRADIGYAVGNALPCVKAAADRVTVNCTEHAIAKIIEDLEREL